MLLPMTLDCDFGSDSWAAKIEFPVLLLEATVAATFGIIMEDLDPVLGPMPGMAGRLAIASCWALVAGLIGDGGGGD